MNIKKRVLVHFERPYSLTVIPELSGEGMPALVTGSEDDGPLLFLVPPDYSVVTTLAEAPGGFVSLDFCEIEKMPYLLAVADFKPGFNGQHAQLMGLNLSCRPSPPITLAEIPYAHRISVDQTIGVHKLYVSTLCGGKNGKDDWSVPGMISVSPLPSKITAGLNLVEYIRNLHKNHGFEPAELYGLSGFLVSCGDGLFWISAFSEDNGSRDDVVHVIDDCEYSDAFMFRRRPGDEPCIFSLSPFHGNCLNKHWWERGFWHKEIIWSDLAFAHVLWSGFWGDTCCLIAGSRRGRMELRLFLGQTLPCPQADYIVIEEGVGAAQMCVLAQDESRLVLAVTAQAQRALILYQIEK